MDITPSLQAQAARSTPAPAEVRAKKAAQDFEAFYISQFISLMKPENTDTEFNGGTGERMFKQELNNEIAKSITKSGGFGIAESVYSALLQQQERQ